MPWSGSVGLGTFWVGRREQDAITGNQGWAELSIGGGQRGVRWMAGAGNLADSSLSLGCLSHLCSELRPTVPYRPEHKAEWEFPQGAELRFRKMEVRGGMCSKKNNP